MPTTFIASVSSIATPVFVLLLAGHLLCMNVSSAGPLLCIWLVRRKATPDSVITGKRFAIWTIWLLLIGILLGLALGVVSYWSGDQKLYSALPYFRRKIVFGIIELGCSLGWMTGYCLWIRWRPPATALTRTLHAGLAVLSATNLLYHFPPLLTVMTKVAGGEMTVTEDVGAAAFRQLAFTPNVLAHSLHFWLASFAVSGVFLFWIARPVSEYYRLCMTGARVAFAATALQLPAGLWLMFTTPPADQSKLVGGNAIASGLFLTSMISAFYLVQNLAALAFGDEDQKLPRRSALLLLATVVLMSGTLHLLRAG